jgi:hypothetical protein
LITPKIQDAKQISKREELKSNFTRIKNSREKSNGGKHSRVKTLSQMAPRLAVQKKLKKFSTDAYSDRFLSVGLNSSAGRKYF